MHAERQVEHPTHERERHPANLRSAKSRYAQMSSNVRYQTQMRGVEPKRLWEYNGRLTTQFKILNFIT